MAVEVVLLAVLLLPPPMVLPQVVDVEDEDGATMPVEDKGQGEQIFGDNIRIEEAPRTTGTITVTTTRTTTASAPVRPEEDEMVVV